MAYVDFDLKGAVRTFGLSEKDDEPVFSDVAQIEPSESLSSTLAKLVPVALGINTEQARREFIISPILIEAWGRSNTELKVFPGVMLKVDETRGLVGYCDYLIARSSKLFYLESPVVAVVEAKREDLVAGLGRCVAEMVGIQLFNEKDGKPVREVYGVVTSGNNWRFLKLAGIDLSIDRSEYSLPDLSRILGILVQIMRR